MRWQIHTERELHRDQWIDVRVADVELPDGRHLDHRLIRVRPGAGVVILNDRDEALLLWRHRFITDVWNYEIPMGGIEPGEDPAAAATREAQEETGWRPAALTPLLYEEPMNGLIDARNHIFLAEAAEFVATPDEGIECDQTAWVPLAKTSQLIAESRIVGGATIAALLLAARARGL